MTQEQGDRLIDKVGGKYISNIEFMNNIHKVNEISSLFKSLTEMSQAVVRSTDIGVFNDEAEVVITKVQGDSYIIGLTKAEIRNAKKEARDIIGEGLALSAIGDKFEMKSIKVFQDDKFDIKLILNNEEETSVVESVDAEIVNPEDFTNMYDTDDNIYDESNESDIQF